MSDLELGDVDRAVRHRLAEVASAAPDGAHLLYAVRQRARRTAVRRRMAAGGTAALALGVAVPVMVVSYQGEWGRGGTDTVLTAPSTAPGRPPTSHLVRAAYQIPVIPVTPGWLPGTVRQRTASSLGLEYLFAGGLPGVRIEVNDNNGFVTATADHIAVKGVPAYLVHNIRERSQEVQTLVWEREPSQWVSVAWMGGTSSGDRAGTDSATLVRIAESLRDAQVPVESDFRLAWLPRGVPDVPAGDPNPFVYPGMMTFTLPDGAALTIKREVRPRIPARYARARAGRWQGWYGIRTLEPAGLDGSHERRAEFYVAVGPDDYVVIGGPTSLDQADMLGIAEGLTLLR
jgi:hypothetical protein